MFTWNFTYYIDILFCNLLNMFNNVKYKLKWSLTFFERRLEKTTTNKTRPAWAGFKTAEEGRTKIM